MPGAVIGILLTLIVESVLSSSCANGYGVIDFNQLNGHESIITDGYNNLHWTNAYLITPALFPNSGYNAVLNGGRNVAVNGFGNTMSISVPSSGSVEAFNISSFIAAAGWGNNLTLTVVGERSGTIVYSQQTSLRNTTATSVVLNWNIIHKITFSTSVHISAASSSDEHFAINNLCVAKIIKPPETLYRCDYWGDPHLIEFPKQPNASVSGTWCSVVGLSVLYQTPYVLLNVVNSGSSGGDIVTSFQLTLYSSSNMELCTLTRTDVLGTPRSCGPDVILSKSGSELNVAYRKATFSAFITYSTWGGGHYKFKLFAPTSQTNAATTTGMCVKGCRAVRNMPNLLWTESTTDKEIVTSAMANTVCDTFMKQTIRQLSMMNMPVETTPGYLNASFQACIIDVTVTGSSQFAQDVASNIITDVFTHTGTFEAEELITLVQNTTNISQQTVNQAELQIETLIQDSTWPCNPDAPVCVMPFLMRQQAVNIGK